MKKLLYFMAIAIIGAVTLVSCGKDEGTNPYAKESKIKVISSDVLFGPNAASGEVVLELQDVSTMEIECKSTWCNVLPPNAGYSGNVTCTVNVEDNIGLEGRTAPVIFRGDKDSVIVCVQQQGIQYTFSDEELVFEMNGGTQVISGESSFPVTVEKDEEWITVSEILGGYQVSVPFNNSGDARQGHVYIKLGDIVTTYTINQKFDRDFSGEYSIFFYTNAAQTSSKTFDVTITRSATDSKAYTMEGITNASPIPLRFDDVNNQLIITNGSYLGQYSTTEWIYACVYYSTLDGASNYYSVSTSTNYDIYFNFEMNQDGKYIITLHNSAPLFNVQRVSQGFYVYTFTTPPTEALATANKKTTLWMVRQPVITQK
ncbi:MAG: hypothetical protein MJY76_08280 [Bacteroidales bacterium]|nr:hypothetical protein [Bacteroidales bacterium]